MNISYLERNIFDIVLPRIKFYESLHGEYEYQYNFGETPRKFMVALVSLISYVISTDEDRKLYDYKYMWCVHKIILILTLLFQKTINLFRRINTYSEYTHVPTQDIFPRMHQN